MRNLQISVGIQFHQKTMSSPKVEQFQVLIHVSHWAVFRSLNQNLIKNFPYDPEYMVQAMP